MKMFASVCLALGLACTAVADVVYLKDGRKFEGAVTENGDEYAIKGKFGTIRVRKADVDRVEMAPSGEYASKAAALGEKDADGHYRLGIWCRDKGMKAEAKVEFEKAIAADPNHEGAHRELGHARVGDRWGTPAELMDSAEALLRLRKTDRAAELMDPLMQGVVDSLDKPLQARAWRIAVSIRLRRGQAGTAADAADRAAELAPATEKVAARTRADIIRASGDGQYDVGAEDLVAAMPGQPEPGAEPLEAGRRPLWDERVMLVALRAAAQRDVDKGRKLVNDAEAAVGSDKDRALRLYASAEDFFDHANDIVPDYGRQYQVEAVRKQVPILLDLANEAVDKANKASPLNHDYGLQQTSSGKVQFTGDGLARYQSDKRDWNAHAARIQEHMKEITRLNARFPAEFAAHRKACDEIRTYYEKRIPEVREFLDKVERALK